MDCLCLGKVVVILRLCISKQFLNCFESFDSVQNGGRFPCVILDTNVRMML